jgi:hypothetical protein
LPVVLTCSSRVRENIGPDMRGKAAFVLYAAIVPPGTLIQPGIAGGVRPTRPQVTGATFTIATPEISSLPGAGGRG